MEYPTIQKTKKVNSYIQEMPSIALRLFNFAAGLLEFLIFVRLTLIFFGANPAASFAKWFYGYTDTFVLPFSGLFNDIYVFKELGGGGLRIEIASPLAMLGYAILLFVILKLINNLKPAPKSSHPQSSLPRYY